MGPPRPRAGILLVTALAACGYLSAGAQGPGAPGQNPRTATFGENVSFAVDRNSLRARGASPELLAKIDASAYRYFRLLGPSFSARTCYAFQDLRWRLPSVAVHGDAHVEQFVVTRSTYGIEDFDQAGFGPAIVDLVRYAASIHVACRKAGFPCDADRAVAAYFTAYRDALDRPPPDRPPAMVQRLRAMSPTDTAAWLSWVDAQIRPLPADDDSQYRRSWARFVTLLAEAQPNRPASRYDIVKLGRVEIGVGSALEKKILVRTRGASDDPMDDLILESRLTSRPTGNECVWRPPHGGSLHVILFTSGYREMSIADLASQADLEELTGAAAHQLAGHFWKSFPEPLRQYLRFAQLHAFDLVQERARTLARDLADEVAREWEKFRAGS
jgi:hypothetical protein